MDRFLSLADDRRGALFGAAGRELGLTSATVEKDFWVCWILRSLFGLSTTGPHLTFKGGTSLSKGWKLIHRFSEDIDVVIDRRFLGFGGDHSPEEAPSHKQRGRRLDELKGECQRHIRDVLRPDLNEHVRSIVPVGNDWRLEIDPDDQDEQTLLFHYPTVTADTGYVRPVVKIELGARSDTDPSESPSISPYLADVFPGEFDGAGFSVRTVAPERTFWEKVALLHEESYRSEGPRARLARHYYDLWCLLLAGVGARADADQTLFERVAGHRAVFFRKSRAVQESFRRGGLRLVPSADRRSAWKRDYDAMRDAMFLTEPPPFDEILEVVATFEREFNGP